VVSERPVRTLVGTSNHPEPAPNRPESGDDGVSAGQSVLPEPLRRLAALIADSPHNLVARGDRAEMLQRHILECDLVAARMQPAGRWMDLGTGGGLPGLVLAYRYPDVAWVLVDATAKKIAAVRSFADALGLDNVTAVHGRAESIAHEPAHRGAYQGVVCRALAQLPVLLELTRGFLGADGQLVAMKGPSWRAELQRAAVAMRVLRFADVHSEELPLPDRSSWVVTMRADGPPPVGYPRRDGLPKQQPLS
jgi:16S rRNA (guanine527-N7)-methyltransferase